MNLAEMCNQDWMPVRETNARQLGTECEASVCTCFYSIQ